MNAMILAAGRGTRLGELSMTTPKALVIVAGEPMLARQIRYLRQGGIERIVVNAHHLADQIERFAASHELAEEIDVVVEPELLGTAGGVLNALPLLGEDFMVLYGDVIVDEPIERMRETHTRLGGACTAAVYRTNEVLGKGTVEVDETGTIVGFQEKAYTSIEGEAYVNAGVYFMGSALLSELPSGVPLDFGHDVFPRALQRGEKMVVHVLEKPVIDMGTPDALEMARERGAEKVA
jgi:NDP-sugar pyrophosphorylase family protein